MRTVEFLWPWVVGEGRYERTAALSFGGFKIRCDLREMLQRQYYFFGTYAIESHLLSIWRDFASQSRLVVDVGANSGIYSLAALAERPDATAHAFEPTLELSEKLKETADLNRLRSLHVHRCAVGCEDGTAVLAHCRGDHGDNEGMNYIRSEGIAQAGDDDVALRSLDSFCDENNIDHIDLLKVDVQGHEAAVLKGAKRLLSSRSIGSLFMEMNWQASSGDTSPANACIALLERNGYVFSAPWRPLRWRSSGAWMRVHDDIIAVPVERQTK